MDFNERYSDRHRKGWYERHLELFDYEESKVATERLLNSRVKFSNARWVIIIAALLVISIVGSCVWGYYQDADLIKEQGFICSLWQNASIGLATGLVLMLYTLQRDRGLSYHKEVLNVLELRLRKYKDALEDLVQIPFEDNAERDGLERNIYLLGCLADLSCRISEFQCMLCASNSKAVKAAQEVNAKICDLYTGKNGCDDECTIREKFELAYKLLFAMINRLEIYAEETRANIFEMQYGKKAILKSESASKSEARIETRRRKRDKRRN